MIILYKLFYGCGIGLVVEHVLAKDETGVRFSYPAQKKYTVIMYKLTSRTILQVKFNRRIGIDDPHSVE